MKKIVFLLTLMSVTILSAQKKHIVVSFAVGKACTADTHLGYQVYTGSNLSQIIKLSEDKVKRDNPEFYRVGSEKNGWNAEKGNYLVIIETKLKYKNCTTYKYGIGFGFNGDEAERNAKKNLSMTSWTWNESKHGYEIIYEKGF